MLFNYVGKVVSLFFDESTKRDNSRWAQKVIGNAKHAKIINGQKPPMPILIGKNKVPAPMAVPNRLSVHCISCWFYFEVKECVIY
ncbi:hypothetical protein TW82_00755 [Pseudoalteromonas fuliginea]|uniref:Uncharacterized protein n=1 Tax=Pseudoalteromonas fuliginea TaxID=1872678 RepID=A0ABD3Y9Y8_9GAMM|nr:hypothetical protein DC53_08075 [Pseudoalteromonas fuliginea]KJZ29815.1 hypothetical protein TW82_00755 [Pseudoalteromonas fuliginea]